MAQKLRWDRAKPWQPSELKYDDGKELSNGVVVKKPLDELASRAKAAEAKWLAELKMKSINDAPPKVRKRRRKKKRQKNNHHNEPVHDDIVLSVLDEDK